MSPNRTFVLCLLTLLASSPTTAPAQPAAKEKQAPGASARVDAHGDPLPPGAVARLGTTRFRHDGGIRFLGYSGDGTLLLTAGGDNTVRFWNARTGKEVRRLRFKSSAGRPPFRSDLPVILAGDGKTLLLGSDPGQYTVVEVASGKTLRQFRAENFAQNRFPGDEGTATVLSHDGRLLMAGGGRNFGPGGAKVRLWDTTTGKLVRELTAADKMTTLTAPALSRDGATVVVLDGPDPFTKFDMGKGEKGPPPARVRFLDVATGKETRSFPAPQGQLSLLRPTPDGKGLLALNQGDAAVRLLDAATGKELRNFTGKGGAPQTLFFSRDGKQLFLVGLNEVTQCDVQTGKEIRSFPLLFGKGDDPVALAFGRMVVPAAALSPDGQTLALSRRASVALWDVRSGKELLSAQGHRDRIDLVAFAPKGGLVLTASGDGSLYLWDPATGRVVRELTRKSPDGENGVGRVGREMMDLFRVRGQFTPDGATVVGLWPGGKLHVWEAATGKLRHHLGGPQGYTGFACAPAGRFVAANGPSGAVELWDLAKGKKTRQFTWMARPAPDPMGFGGGDQGGAYSAAFSPDGRMLLSGAMVIEPNGLKSVVRGWEMASGRERLRLEGGLDVGGGGGMFSMEAVGRALDAFVMSFAFSPDGKFLAEAGLSNIKMRDLQTGEEVRIFGGRQVSAPSAVFSPDSKFLIAGQQDGTLRLWDVATGTVLLDVPAHSSPVGALAFSADGKLLASGAHDSSVLLWEWDHVRRQATAPKTAPAPAAREALWADLAGEDAVKAYAAIKALSAAPAETVALLKPRLRPVAAIEPARLEQLLADLDHKQFAVRQKAEKGLEKLGDLAAKAIRAKLDAAPPLEVGRRLEALLERLAAGEPPAEVLRALRAVEVLERIGTAEARQVLEGLSHGAAGHRVTEEARSALGRLTRQPPP